MTKAESPHDWLLSLLPPEHVGLTRSLLQLLWIPSGCDFLFAAVTRLKGLMKDHLELFEPEISKRLTQEDLGHWLHEVTKLASDPKLQPVLASPFDSQKQLKEGGRHFLWGYFIAFPTYVAILTAREDADPLRTGHDRLTAMYLAKAMVLQATDTWDHYITYIEVNTPKRGGETATATTNSTTQQEKGKRTIPPKPHASSITNASRAVRSLLEESPESLLISLATVANATEFNGIFGKTKANDISNQLRTHLQSMASFLLARHRTHSTATGTQRNTQNRSVPTAPVPDKPLIGTFLKTYFAGNKALELPPDLVVIPVPSERDLRLAAELDVPIEELLQPPTASVSELESEDQAPDAIAVRIWTQNEIAWRRRMNQYHRWHPNYVNVDDRLAIIQWLQGRISHVINTPSAPVKLETVLGPLLVLASLATGRPAQDLAHVLTPVETWDGLSAINASVVYDLNKTGFWVLVARPETEAKAEFGARPVNDYVLLPDHLACAPGMQFWVKHTTKIVSDTIEPDPITPVTIDPVALDQAIDTTHKQLQAEYGVSPTSLWTLVPRMLLETSGHLSASALLTAWRPANAAVDLHYLTPPARTMVAHYRKAMRSFLGQTLDPSITLPEVVTPEPSGWIGMPNTPTAEHLRAVTAKFHACANHPDQLTPSKRHNLMSLYVITMATFAIGIRHTIAIDPRCRQMDSFDIAHFREKGATRFLVVPARLGKQLRHYDDHRARVASWTGMQEKLDQIGNPLFFLLDAAEHPTEFHPGRFGSYLSDFDIRFELPLNSLRRLVFTELVEAGLTGISLDYYIGHSTDGREPFVPGSGVIIGEFVEMANHVDRLLSEYMFQEMVG